MTRSRTFFALLLVALLVATAVPVGAASSGNARAARDAARARKAKAATELKTLRASESELLGAAKALGDQVLAQAARVDAARQAVAAANAEMVEADASLRETKEAIDRLHDLVVERAVAAYMAPHRQGLDDFGDTGDLAASARKQALLDAVAANDDDLIDELNAAEEDYAIQLEAAKVARARAQARKAQTEARLAALEKAEKERRRLAEAVSTRQREVLAEIASQDKVATEFNRILSERARAVTPGGGSSTARNAGGCIWPARGRVTSEYGRRWGRLHAGMDIGASTGTPIWAAKAGVVIFSGRQSGYGNVIVIDHGGGMTTLYGHQSRLLARDNQSVAQGQRIGSVGSTGRSTGPHLHFETRYGGSPRNPRGCLR